ncbi:hypothetical protein RJ639_002889 [Escallonia herrerae]|uniref:Chromo domain-containing protein n=1 Tax=Escallonia herrerae TaxID=1293975 RepID=A0AA89B0M5_9ASTE|nr:hypothetical protein RJ639_002889 [Escallonia herrerae]
MIVGICWRTLLASGKLSATHGFLCAIKGHRVSGGIRAAVAQGTVASAKKILWDSLLRKTMANTKERIDALEAQIRDMIKSDPDAPGILKQFSLRLDALEGNLEATDNARYAENMKWEGRFQELQDQVEHYARHVEGSVWEYCQAFSALMLDISDMSAVDRLFFFMEGLKPWARTELNRRRVNNLNEAIIAAESLLDYNSEPQRPPQRRNPSRSIGGKKPGGQAPNQSWGSKSSWASNSSTQQKSGVGFKAKLDASTSGEVKKPPFRGCFLCQGPHVIANCPQRQMMNAFFDNIGQVQRGAQSGSQSRHPPADEQTDVQDYEEEDAVGAFPQWCNAVTTQVGNPEESLTEKKPKDMLPKKKSDECHSVAYENRKLNEAECRYTTHEKELLAVVHCLRVWRHYLLGSSFIVRTDNTAVNHFLSQSKLSAKQARWQELLAEFNFMLKYRAGSTNSVADALSRRAQSKSVNVPNDEKSPRAISFSEEWRQNIDLAHSYLEKVARRMKKYADKNRRSQEFNVGNKVMVKLLPQDRKFLRGRDSRLLQKYEGPLTIVKKIGKMAYKVDPPHWWSHQLHPVFHVSMLKPFYEDTSDPSRGQIRRQGLKPKAAGKRVAEAILNDRVITASRKCHQEYLVKWQGHMNEENTWERAADLSAYTDKIEAYHMQKLTRASTALVGENVTGCPLHPPSTAPPRPSNMRPCTLASSSSFQGSTQDSHSHHRPGPQLGWKVEKTLLEAVHLVSPDETADNMIGQSP